jgi:hypothetical protein
MKTTNYKLQMAKIFSASLCLCGLIFISAFGVFAQNDGSQQNVLGKAGTFVIRNARIVTVSGATIENGSLVIQNGKISAIGANVTVPAGAETIDGSAEIWFR